MHVFTHRWRVPLPHPPRPPRHGLIRLLMYGLVATLWLMMVFMPWIVLNMVVPMLQVTVMVMAAMLVLPVKAVRRYQVTRSA